MTSAVQDLRSFLDAGCPLALVEVAATKGSTPRETGAYMLVSPSSIHGTIGGGQLEYMATDKARHMLRRFSPLEGEMPAQRAEGVGSAAAQLSIEGTQPSDIGAVLRTASRGREDRIAVDEVCATLDVPLGPEIGQCCGGRVEVLIRPVDKRLADELVAAAQASEARQPHVYIFGGGHVGHAMAAAIALLPVHLAVVETRGEALADMPDAVVRKLTAMPEDVVRSAPAGSAFAILTHDHALDFLIVAEALKRDDAAYVGMIGSRTKKATFRSWFLKSAGGTEAELARLVSPIGGDAVKDKRPEVIAALAAAEIMTAVVLHGTQVANEPRRPGATGLMSAAAAHGDTAFAVPLFDGFVRRIMR